MLYRIARITHASLQVSWVPPHNITLIAQKHKHSFNKHSIFSYLICTLNVYHYNWYGISKKECAPVKHFRWTLTIKNMLLCTKNIATQGSLRYGLWGSWHQANKPAQGVYSLPTKLMVWSAMLFDIQAVFWSTANFIEILKVSDFSHRFVIRMAKKCRPLYKPMGKSPTFGIFIITMWI